MEIVEGQTKVCKKCGKKKGYSAFHIDRRTSDGLKYRCRLCTNKTKAMWRARNADKVQAGRRESYQKNLATYRAYSQSSSRRRAIFTFKLRSYGLTIAQFEEMVKAQKGRCAICDKLPSEALGHNHHRLCIDHDHKTGAVRGLLCVRCNAGLGAFSDSAELMENAKNYITKHTRQGE